MAAGTDRKRPGRPRGNSDARNRILAGARGLFARNGFANTSIRSVAEAAGVDSALVHHYFGTKQQLFAAAIDIPVDPMSIIAPLREAPVEGLGLRLPSLLLPLWDSEIGAGLVATLRSMLAGSDIGPARMFFREVVVPEIAARVDDPSGTGVIRAEFVATQLMGVVVARYILELEPFASLPAERIAATIAPNLQHYLTGDLPAACAP